MLSTEPKHHAVERRRLIDGVANFRCIECHGARVVPLKNLVQLFGRYVLEGKSN